jgi:predicted  nucleic acid-binding Zn-ribbon protein
MVISVCFVRKVAEYGDQFVFCPQGGIMLISLCFVRKVAEYGDQFLFCPQGGRIW